MTPYTPYRTYRHRPYAGRRSGSSLFVPVLVALIGLLALAVTLPFSGIHVPGARRVLALADALPLPWKTPRPVYVPLPDLAEPGLTQAQPLASVAAAPANVVPTPVTAAPSPTPVPAIVAPPAPAMAAPPAVPAVAVAQAPAALRLENFRHQWQTWNNCGPATITMAMSHFGRTETQAQAAPFLKPNANDKNVGPDELVGYVRSVGMQADMRVAGDLGRLKLLLANGVPVVVEMWFTPHPNDGMGHYRLLIGYDDAARRFTAYDSYDPPGMNVALPYGPFDADWRVFNRTYIPVYTAAQAPVVAAILGADVNDSAMWERAFGLAQAEIAASGNDPYAWFNAGASLVALGRPVEAVDAFDRARALRLPWRMLWYQFQPFEAYLAAGRTNDVLTLAGANLQQANDLEESHYYRGRALQEQGQITAARSAYLAARQANPRYAPASHALAMLG